MRTNKKLWLIGYLVAFIIILVIAFTEPSKNVDIALCLLFSIIIGISNSKRLNLKRLNTDEEYKRNVLDERLIAIKEKTGNAVNIINNILLGCSMLLFIGMGYKVPAAVIAAVLVVQPIILIIVSNNIEKKM